MSIPRPEYPNPSFVRTHWLSLNGVWQFAFDPRNEGEQSRWYLPEPARAPDPFTGTISVPFPWESKRSGVGNAAYRGVAWYRRRIDIPEGWPPDLESWLHFAAVDWEARVWVNGEVAAEHTGGFTPFALNLAPYAARPGESLDVVVRVRDDCDAATLLGKQTLGWYTPSSGIWQSVWLEGRPRNMIAAIRLSPSLAERHIDATLSVSICDAGEHRITVRSPDGEFAAQSTSLPAGTGMQQCVLRLDLPNVRAWSPEDPHLVNVVCELEHDGLVVDTVGSYTGVRDLTTAHWDGKPYQYMLLNGQPLYLRAALDQAFHPDGLLSYPSDEAIRADIQAARDLGLNCLRCHIKLNDPRYYYWADRLGVLIMQDIPNALVYSAESRGHWREALDCAVQRDFNHPSIFCWVLFNETWGLGRHRSPESWRWLAEQVAYAKALDPTRFIEDNSACRYDHVVSELNSWHFYIAGWQEAREHIQHVVDSTFAGSNFNYIASQSALPEAQRYVQSTQPLLNSEYAALSARQGDHDISVSLKYLTTDLRRHDKICGYIYTELADIEWEHNGLLEYDRTTKEYGYDAFVPDMSTADLLGADVVGLDCPPAQTIAPEGTFEAPAFVSHWSDRDLTGCTLRWRVDMIDRFGERYVYRDGALPVTPKPFAVTPAGNLRINLPAEPGLATISLVLHSAGGEVVARNYVNVEVWSHPAPRAERTPSGWAVRCSPASIERSTWGTSQPADSGRFARRGHGEVAYAVALPDGLDLTQVSGARLVFEAGTCAAQERRNGWGRYQPHDYPQTEPARRLPGPLQCSINGVAVGKSMLSDDANDARGILTFLNAPAGDCSYGDLVELTISQDMLAAIHSADAGRALHLVFSVPAGAPERGLTLFDERTGAYPLDPTLLFDLNHR